LQMISLWTISHDFDLHTLAVRPLLTRLLLRCCSLMFCSPHFRRKKKRRWEPRTADLW
jgi:hypothetical protein